MAAESTIVALPALPSMKSCSLRFFDACMFYSIVVGNNNKLIETVDKLQIKMLNIDERVKITSKLMFEKHKRENEHTDSQVCDCVKN